MLPLPGIPLSWGQLWFINERTFQPLIIKIFHKYANQPWQAVEKCPCFWKWSGSGNDWCFYTQFSICIAITIFYSSETKCDWETKRERYPKCSSRQVPSWDSGKANCCHLQGRVVDSSNESDFKVRLDSCKQLWITRESTYICESQLSFSDYFMKHTDVVCYNMLKDLRTAAGLGSLPAKITTNRCESINACCY